MPLRHRKGPTPQLAVHQDLVTTLALPVTLVAGTPFEAAFYIGFGTGPGQTAASAQATCAYRVRGLPPGVHAITCTGADVTPTSRVTWGALKTRYR